MSGSTELCLLAWRLAFELAIAGGLIPTAAAAEIEPDTEPEMAAAETEAELVGGRESVSTTTLELPEVCLRSEVNSAGLTTAA